MKTKKRTKLISKSASRKLRNKVPKKEEKQEQAYFWGMENEKGEREFRLHSGQSKALRSKTRFTAAIAGTGGGKTVLGPLWVMRRIKKLMDDGVKPPYTGMIIAPTYKVLSRATSPMLVETFRGTALQGRFLESKGHYVLPNGLGILYLLSADSPDGLEGGQLDIGVWLDEGGQVSYKAWLALCRRTGVNQAPLFITTTPYLCNWLKTNFLDLSIAGDKDYTAISWPSILNPSYPKAEFERAKRSLSPAVFDLMYRGQFTTMEGLVYPSFHLCIVDRVEGDGLRVGGIDFGWRAPFCALSGFIRIEDGKDVLYITNERYKTECRLKDHAATFKDRVIWYADPSEPEMIGDLRSWGHRIRKAKNSIKAGIEAMNARILTGRLRVKSSCVNLISEAGLYQYPQEDEGENPAEGIDHAMDALRYICLSIVRRGAKKAKPRTVHTRRPS